MFTRSRLAILLAAVLLFLPASPVLADDENKRGFHGWGDSQKMTPGEAPVEARSEEVKEGVPVQKKEAEAAETEKPKADKPREADSKVKDPVREKIRTERKAFYEDTKSLRQDIYQKRLELRSELAKKKPSARRAKSIQKDLLKLRTKLDQKRLEHLLEMKKIDPRMGWRRFGGQGGDGGCQDCPYQGRGYGGGYHMMGPGYGGGHHMMGPGYGRHHMWNDDDDWEPRRQKGSAGERNEKSSFSPSATPGDLSESDAVEIVRDFLKSTRNLNLEIGALSDAGDAYMVEIMTRSGSVFDRVLVDKQNGYMRPAR